MTTQLYRERQLCSENESVGIRYVNDSFVAGTSASSPGVPRQIHISSKEKKSRALLKCVMTKVLLFFERNVNDLANG